MNPETLIIVIVVAFILFGGSIISTTCPINSSGDLAKGPAAGRQVI